MENYFYFDVAAFIISFILWIGCNVRYNIIDLKDKIYLHMLHVSSGMFALNIIAAYLISNQFINGIAFIKGIFSLNIIFVILFWYFLNNYMYEYIHNKNYYSRKRNIVFGFPVLLMLIFIVFNHFDPIFFDLEINDHSFILDIKNMSFFLYVLIIISMIYYMIMIIQNKNKIIHNKDYIFFCIPILMLIGYSIQMFMKPVMLTGFLHSLLLVLFYIYIYKKVIKIDNLTNLPNEETFKKMLDYHIALKKDMKILMITLNDFKRVNYEYGYQNGSKFIEMIASYLEEQAPKNCIARYGGDKYALIFENYSDEEIQSWCDRVLDRFNHSWKVNNLSHKISTCITIVDYPQLANDSNEIIELLEYLNTHAKKYKKNQCIICTEKFREKMKKRVRIVALLNKIISEEKVHVVYQPILDVNKNRYTRAEALIKIENSEIGHVSKEEFTPIAEENGFINQLGYVLLKRVCKYIHSFIEEGKQPPVISVNFTRQQIMAEDVIEKVLNILEEFHLSPEYIAIELSESVFSIQYEDVKVKMIEMHKQGFRFYLDGFGIGILELSHLLELPFEMVKINRNVIKEAEDNNSIYLLLSALVAVFEENGKKILGEGIDTKSLKDITDLLFINYLQGDYYSIPISSKDAKKEFLRENIDAQVSEFNKL